MHRPRPTVGASGYVCADDLARAEEKMTRFPPRLK
jgi:hypothetical protein